MADIKDFSAVNEIYQTYFTEDFPARAAMQVMGGHSECTVGFFTWSKYFRSQRFPGEQRSRLKLWLWWEI